MTRTSGFNEQISNSYLDNEWMNSSSPFQNQTVTTLASATIGPGDGGIVDNHTLVLDYIRQFLGVQHRNRIESIILSVVYGLIFISGIVGNVCTGIIVLKKPYMRTSTNLYLCSLAISDVLTLILGLPPELYTIWEAYPWIFGQPYCLFKTFVTEMTSSASILTITAFTVERYVAICHPLKTQIAMSSLQRALRVITVVWVTACLTALPYPLFTRTYHFLDDPISGEPISDSLVCSIPNEWQEAMKRVFQFSTFSLFVLPMSVITVLYIMIGLSIRKSTGTSSAAWHPKTSVSGSPSSCRPVDLHDSNKSRTTMQQSRKTVLKMLVAVVVAFFICWAPFHAQRLMTIYIPEEQWTEALLEFQTVLFYISGILYFVGCTVNPILYNLMSRRYRQAFRETLCHCCNRVPTTVVTRGRQLVTRRQHVRSQQFGVQETETDTMAACTTGCSVDRTGKGLRRHDGPELGLGVESIRR